MSLLQDNRISTVGVEQCLFGGDDSLDVTHSSYGQEKTSTRAASVYMMSELSCDAEAVQCVPLIKSQKNIET